MRDTAVRALRMGPAALVATLLLAACGGGGDCEAGAAVVSEEGPSLVVDSVRDEDGNPVGSVQLSDVRFEGLSVPRRALVDSVESSGLTLDGGVLTCTVPCGLSGTEGRWQFRVTGPDAATAQVDVRGDPKVSPGGCSPARGEVPLVTVELTPGGA
jgi:hypothetical protein